MNPLQLLNATIRRIVYGAKPTAAQTAARRVTPRAAIKTAADYGPDVAIGVPVEMTFSQKPDIRRAVINAANEVALTAATGGTNAIPQIAELVTSFNRDNPTIRMINNVSRVYNPSHITEALTENILYGRRDPVEHQRDMQAATEAQAALRMINQARGSVGY